VWLASLACSSVSSQHFISKYFFNKSFLFGFALGASLYGFFSFPIIALVFEYSTQHFPDIPLNITNSIFSSTGQILGAILQM
jgi:hypothetical protein